MFQKIIIALAMLTSLTSCGSFRTLKNTEQDIVSDLKNKKTYCASVSRIYSGVNYDMCVLHANPKNTAYARDLIFLYAIDLGACAIIDTLALPYTLYDQNKNGSILIK